MPSDKFTRSFFAKIVADGVDGLTRVVSLNGVKYGSQGEVPGAPGISSSSPRVLPTNTLLSAAMDWRGLVGAAPELKSVGSVRKSSEGGEEFNFEWAPSAQNTEDIVGSLGQVDAIYGLVDPDLPGTCDHGLVVDSFNYNGVSGFRGLCQWVNVGLAAAQQWTFSAYVAPIDPTDTTARNIKVILQDSGATAGNVFSAIIAYTGGGKYQRVSVTGTFVAGVGPIADVRVSPMTPSGLSTFNSPGMLVAAAQLELAASASAYERTSYTVQGARNKLFGSHFPTRREDGGVLQENSTTQNVWHVRTTAGHSYVVLASAGRGPEVRATVPTAGTVDWNVSTIGVNASNGLFQLRPVDTYGQVGDKFSSTSTGRCGRYQAPARTPPNAADKTYIASAWVRHTGANVPTSVGIMISPWVSGVHQFDDIKEFTPSKCWRRIWSAVYVNGTYTTVNAIEAYFFSNDAASGKDTEWFGFQLEEVSGNNPRPPADYEPTTTVQGSVNLLLQSQDAATSWSSSNCTVTVNTAYAPMEYYDAVHDDFGRHVTRVRINPGGLGPVAADWHSAAIGDKEDVAGGAFSIGAYGSEQAVAINGDFDWAAGVLTGWTITGGSQYFLQTTGAPQAWTDDEEATSPEGVRHIVEGLLSTPNRYISRTITLAAGWNTVRLKTARAGVGSTSTMFLALQNVANSKYMNYDHTSWPDTTARWVKSTNFRFQGVYSPDYGVSVWHVHVETAGSHNIRLAAYGTAAMEVLFDQLRVWSDGGALYASTDRTETQGASGFRIQGMNVLARGVVDDSVDADDVKINVRVRDYLHGTQQPVQAMTTQPNCQVKFRGLECGYTQQPETFTADSVGTAHTVSSTQYLEAGRYILGVNGVSPVQVLTITDATHFTTVTPQSYLTGQHVVYADCKKTYPDCDRRRRTHRYSGFRATQALQAMGSTNFFWTSKPWFELPGDLPAGNYLVPNSPARMLGALSIKAQDTLNHKTIFDDITVPLVFGRKSVKLLPIETHATKFASDNSEWLTTFYAICMGELADVRLFFTPDGPMSHDPVKGVMVFWHPGRQGEDLWWTLTDQYAGTTETVQKIDNQRRDFRTNTDNAYNRVAYAVVQIIKGSTQVDLNDPTKVIELWGDLKAQLVQVYDRYGVAVGSPAWSRNPIWIAVWALKNDTFGPGMPHSLFDWDALAAAAAVCDQPIVSSQAVTKIRTAVGGGGSTVHQVVAVDGFAPEMPCTVNGVAKTVLFVDPINLRLFFSGSPFTVATTDVVQGLPPRFTCDLVVGAKTDLPTFLDMVLGSCRGALTFDGGKIGIIVQRSQTDPAATTFSVATPTPSTTLAGVVPNSLKYSKRRGSVNNFNAMELTYECGQLVSGSARVLKYFDADRGGLDFPRPLKVEASGCDTADQALRAFLPRFAMAAAVAAGIDTEQDVRGMTIKSGPSMLRAQVGDFIVVSRTGRTTSKRSRIQSITIDPKLNVSIDTMPEARLIRPEGFTVGIDPYTDFPNAATAHGTQLGLGTITLAVTQSAAAQLKAEVTVDGYTAGPGTSAGTHLQKFIAFELHASTTAGFTPTTGAVGLGGTLVAVNDGPTTDFVWNVPESLLEVPLYIKVAGLQGLVSEVPEYSAEIPITIYRTDRPTSDPTQQEGSNVINMVYGGDFNNASDWITDGASAWVGNYQQPTAWLTPKYGGVAFVSHTDPSTNVAITVITPVTDLLDTTTFMGTSTADVGGITAFADIMIHSFGAGTNQNCRPYVRLRKSAVIGAGQGSIKCYYALDKAGAPSAWILFATAGGTLATDFFGPELLGVNYTTFGIRVDSVPLIPPLSGTKTMESHLVKCAVDQKGAPAFTGTVSGDYGTIYGNGTSYGNLYRAFPAKTPTGTQVAFVASTLNHFRIQLRKHLSTDTLDANGVEVRVYDADTGNSWSLGTIASNLIGTAWKDYAMKFSPGSSVVGTNLQIEVRTRNTKAIDIDKLLVARGDTIFAWTTAPQEHAEGFFGNFSNGDATGFTKGSWVVGVPKVSNVG